MWCDLCEMEQSVTRIKTKNETFDVCAICYEQETSEPYIEDINIEEDELVSEPMSGRLA